MDGEARSNPRSSFLEDGRMRMLPVLLSSSLTMAVPGEGGLLLSGACRITHGPWDCYFENIVGKPVASIRRCLATVFSIPDDAEAFISGAAVAPESRLREDDWLEFSKQWGRKEAANFLGTNFGHREPNDFYPTPAHATLALLSRERFGRAIWEQGYAKEPTIRWIAPGDAIRG
jgi:hypothetical protein